VWNASPPSSHDFTSTIRTDGRPAGVAVASARPLHVGRSTIVVETVVTDGRDRPVAKVTQTQLVLRSLAATASP